MFIDSEMIFFFFFFNDPATTEIYTDDTLFPYTTLFRSAASSRQTQLVADVDAFPGHIACDSASRSECVVPLVADDGRLLGVLDLDSPLPARFDAVDGRGLEAIARAWVEIGRAHV